MSEGIRLAVARDYHAEGWPSMDLCADQLIAHLPASVRVEDIAPPFRRFFSRAPLSKRLGFNADRLINRHFLLPRIIRRAARDADFVHIVDHSYAHLVNAVPHGHAGVYCHDLDAFRSILKPETEPRPWWFRRMVRRTLHGLTRAVLVFHSTVAVGRQLLERQIVSADRLIHAPYGVATEFVPDPRGVAMPIGLDGPFVLHVGNNVPRKRLDVLLDAFGVVRKTLPHLRLVQVGGPWPAAQLDQIARLSLESHVSQVRGLSRKQLAELYRRAAVVLVTSEAEGFGLPVIEALACGAVVVASDIPTLREVGGSAAIFCPVADVAAWVGTLTRVLLDPALAPEYEMRLAQAARYSWRQHARIIANAYLALR